jgi:ATP-dependent Clp protease ATP-binding subunit ClpB
MQPTDPDKFTDTAWEAVTKSQDVVRAYKQQQLECIDLPKIDM